MDFKGWMEEEIGIEWEGDGKRFFWQRRYYEGRCQDI